MFDKDSNIMFIGGLIEYIARKTMNKRIDIVNIIGYTYLEHMYNLADVFHCDSLEANYIQLQDDFIFPIGCTDISIGIEDDQPIKSPYEVGEIISRIIRKSGTIEEDYFKAFWSIYNSNWLEKLLDFTNILYWLPSDFHVLCYKENRILYEELY